MRSLISLLLVLASLAPAHSQDPVIVTVDGTPIYGSELSNRIQDRYGEQSAKIPPEQLRQIKGQLIESMIGEILLTNAALREGIKISAAELREHMRKTVSEIDPDLNIETFLQQSGISPDQFREDTKRNLLMLRLVDLKTANLPPPTEEELRKTYEEFKDQFVEPERISARHILKRVTRGMDNQEIAKKRLEIEEIRQFLISNPKAEFAAVATKWSEDGSAPQGGYLGEFQRGQMSPAFEKAAFAQEVGTVGQVIQSEFGFHIIKVEAHYPTRQLPFEEVKDFIKEELAKQKSADVMKEYVDACHAAAEIVPGPSLKPRSESDSNSNE